MEGATLESISLLASAERFEVLCQMLLNAIEKISRSTGGLGNDGHVQLHNNSANCLSISGHIEEHLGAEKLEIGLTCCKNKTYLAILFFFLRVFSVNWFLLLAGQGSSYRYAANFSRCTR